MVVVTDAGLNANAKRTYAHEYTHALQDAAFDLDTLETVRPARMTAASRTALIEGDATVPMLAWAFDNLTPAELAEISSTPSRGIPGWMVDQLEFPYTDGLTWAAALADDPADPPIRSDRCRVRRAARLDRADHPHREMGSARGAGHDRGADLAAAKGEGGGEVDATPIGEETIGVILSFHGLAPTVADEAGAGWGGDRAVIAAGPGRRVCRLVALRVGLSG